MKKLLALGIMVSFAAYGAAQDSHANPRAEVHAAVHFDTSPPLRDIVPELPRFGTPHEAPKPLPFHPNGLPEGAADPVVQNSANVLVAVTNGLNFAGVGQGDYGFSPDAAPPDTNGAVGATQYVQWVNESFAVFDKTTGAIAPGFPKPGNSIWSGFGGSCQADNDGDPIAQYDKANNRWILTQFAVSAQPYMQCVAVSTTSDATGSYNRYAFSYGNGFNDYPKLGVWPDAYYITFNIFNNGSSFAGSKLCAYDAAKMRAGTAATQQCFQLSTSFGGVLPGDWDGPDTPAAGEPEFFLNFGTNSLNLWKFHVDWTTPANTTLTGPTNIPVAAFSSACGGGTCIPQPGTSQKLDSLADRLMYRLAWSASAAGSAPEALVVNHSVKVGGNKRAEIDGVRWYEIRSPNATPSVFQQGTFSPDSNSRWMGSIARDKVGNIALGFSVSSASLDPSIRFTGRVPADPAGTMEAETSIKAGSGAQQRSLNRWGDYSSLSIDPTDHCTMFYTTEYLKTNGTFNWSTQIGSFKFPSCQ